MSVSYDLTPEAAAAVANPNPKHAVAWVQAQESNQQSSHASRLFNVLVAEAGRPRAVSGNACVRLCGFVEQCSKAPSEPLFSWGFSPDTIQKLYTFYLEWNESDQHRSMKLVLELIISLIRRNPDRTAASAIKNDLLADLLSIVTARSIKPVVRSAMKILEHFMAKQVITLDELKSSYCALRGQPIQEDDGPLWQAFMGEVSDRMHQQVACPTAGKLLVCVYRSLRQRDRGHGKECVVELWQPWLLQLVVDDLSLLEAVKNYIFLPLFKGDKDEALRFLRRMNVQSPLSDTADQGLGAHALLRLAALESGKKVGLVEEPALGNPEDQGEHDSSITPHESVLQSVLGHPSHEVRSLALSLLIASPSTIRPFSSTAFHLLRQYIGAYFADSDAKFRTDVSGKAKDMFRRVRGAIYVLKKSIPRARAAARKASAKADHVDNATPGPILYRSNLIQLPEKQLVDCLAEHESFLGWYIHFLYDELTPTASYQRHIASLKGLMYVFRMEADVNKNWETDDDQALFFDLFDGKWTRALLDLLMDPFDDTRDMASSALRCLLSDSRYRRFTLSGKGVAAQEMSSFLERAVVLARRTARADHSDGVGRANQLLYRFSHTPEARIAHISTMVSELERKLVTAEADLGHAVLEAPLHGDFASLCSTWQVVSDMKFLDEELVKMRELQERLVSASERVWLVARDVLCDDSPEGHLPQDLEELDGLDTKDVLSYSFRSTHESSNLLRMIVLTLRNQSREGSIMPSREIFSRIGNLTFTELCTLRHRGAFSTVSQTFATCCQHSKHLDEGVRTSTFLCSWYDGAMSEISSQRSTTRRSAGIPSLITGILSANAAYPSFDSVMDRLMEIAEKEAVVTATDGSNLPQVHAFNCLKDIFKNSLLAALGNKSITYLPSCLKLAASGLKSEVWAIRNCGLILLRSLIDVLFGTHESKAMIEAGWDGKANRIPYYRYPELPEVLLDLLESGHQLMVADASSTMAAESVFPALDIVRRAGPPELLRGQIQAHVSKYLSSQVWHVRDMAARTLCSCLLHDKWLAVVEELLQDSLQSPSSRGQNYIHGVLVTMRLVVARFGEVAPRRLTDDLPQLANLLRNGTLHNIAACCPEILAAYLELVNKAWGFQAANSLPLQVFPVIEPTWPGTALFRIQKTINDVFIARKQSDPLAALRHLLDQPLHANTMIPALESLAGDWGAGATRTTTLAGLCQLYADICIATHTPDVKAAALKSMTAVLEELILSDKTDMVNSSPLVDLWNMLPLQPVSPDLSKSIIRASGPIMVVLKVKDQVAQGTQKYEGLGAWGRMVLNSLNDDNPFDARLAGAEALSSFFSFIKSDCTTEHFLPALMAIYKCLNDDDDDIRAVGSAAASPIVGQAVVPLEAADRLLQFLVNHFNKQPTFWRAVEDQLTGAVTAADGIAWDGTDDPLTRALDVDDALFAVEEQNLFIDEVREARRWSDVLVNARPAPPAECFRGLDSWVVGGLRRMQQQLLGQEDGALGWASNPQAFAVCVRLACAAGALVKVGIATPELQGILAETRAKVAACDGHLSGHLQEAFKGDMV